MKLRDEQQRMLRLLKHGAPASDIDSILLEKLELQRKIIVWWRCFQFEHWLILTSKLLKDQRLMEHLVVTLYQQHDISSYPAEAGELFVNFLLQQPISPLIKSVAMLESALIDLKDLSNLSEYRIRWTTEPFGFLDAILNGKGYSLEHGNTVLYEMVLSNRIPGKIKVHPSP